MSFIKKHFGKLNNVGMSLVELVCAIGIMSLVGASVAGFMIVSANTYSRGTTEVQLQEDAQLLASQINNLVQDSSEASTPSPERLELKRDGKDYAIYRDADDTVYYSVDGSVAPMAENVKVLVMDATDFSKNGVVQIYICLEKNSMTYAGNYTATSRNVSIVTAMTEGELTMTYTPEYVLEPNQTYPISAVMDDGSGIDYELIGATDPLTVLGFDSLTGKRTITIGANETSSKVQIILSSQTRKESDGLTPRVQHTADVYIRRVNSLTLNKTSSSTSTANGTVYTFTSTVDGYNLDSMLPAIPDPGFQAADPGAGVAAGIYTTGILPRDVKFTAVAVNKSGEWVTNPSSYFTITVNNGSGVSTPTFSLRLNKNLEMGEGILITAMASHSYGRFTDDPATVWRNITGVGYGAYAQTYYITGSYFSFDGQHISRGSDQEQGNFSAYSTLKTILVLRGAANDDQFPYFKKHRFREVTIDDAGNILSYNSPWTQWRENKAEAGGNAINLRPDATLSLDIDKAYEVEVQFGIVSSKTGEVLWPFPDMAREDYTVSGIIKPVSIKYNLVQNGHTLASNFEGLGTGEAPFTINAGSSCSLNITEIKHIKADNLNSGSQYNYEVERWNYDNGTGTFSWGPVDMSRDFKRGAVDKNYNFQVERGGIYRVKLHLTGVPARRYVPASDNYVNAPNRDYEFCNETTGKGYFYFKVDGNSNDWNSKYFDYNGIVLDKKDYCVIDGGIYKLSNGSIYNMEGTVRLGSYSSETVSGVYCIAAAFGNTVYYSQNGGSSFTTFVCTKSGGNFYINGTQVNDVNSWINNNGFWGRNPLNNIINSVRNSL